MRKIILKSGLSLGDIVCLSAVPRELHRQYPGQFEVAVDTPFADLWANNPHVIPATIDMEVIEAHYDRDAVFSVHQSNQRPVHMLTSYCQDVANSLGLPSLSPAVHAGDIHLSRDEYQTMSIPHAKHNCQRFWLIGAGGKTDATVKTWVPEFYQRVVDYFRNRLQFVQVGAVGDGHYHYPLNGVINLVGQTGVRDLIRLVHSACGVLCGITSLMHLAAAVPLPVWQKRPRPCVVVAGGREPRTWYSYPSHRILETVGSLQCCRDGGCWHSHSIGIKNDGTERLCERVVNNTPRCMSLIRPEAVILEIEKYLETECVE